jgi:di/tricarboxylate transporter
METEPTKRLADRQRRVPDKYLAIGIFLLLLGLYLWKHDSLVERMTWMMFGLVIMAISDGLRRVRDSFADRRKKSDTPQRSSEK